MSNIRRQSILSSFIVYFGFAIGFINTYFFTREGAFTEAQYGLTGIFIAIATMMLAFAQLGMPTYIYKFFPYYKDHLSARKNDMITWALLVGTVGFSLVIIAGIVFKSLVVRKFIEHSPEVLTYYGWIFPFGFGLTIYSILEAYAWSLHKSVLTNYLREVQWRLFTTLLIVLFITGVIKDFDVFIKLYAFTYAGIALFLLLYLIYTKKIHFTFTISKVTRRLLKKIVAMSSFTYGGVLIFSISQVFDSIIIAVVLPGALAKVGIFTLAQNIASLIQAPQRGVIAASIGPLSKAWKDKAMGTIRNIYTRSSINQLLFALGMFMLIWLNFSDAVYTFQLKETYLRAYYVFLLLGATKIIDMGTGVNSQIIGTSTFWKFEFVSGIILLSLALPLNYFLTKRLDIIGPALSNLIAIIIYNSIRITFLYRKFRLMPFTKNTAYALVLAAAGFITCYSIFKEIHGLPGMFLRSITFLLIYITGAIVFKLSPDIIPVWQSFKKRFEIK